MMNRTLLVLGLAASPAIAGVVADDCAWHEFLTIPGISNAPDNVNTRIYETAFVAAPGVETVLRGSAPAARFWSFAVVSPTTTEIAGLYDEEILPPASAETTYEVVVKSDCSGETRRCMAAGEDADPLQNAPSGRLFYRLYLPEGDERGGVALPSIEYRTAADAEPSVLPPSSAGEACATTELALFAHLRSDGDVGSKLGESSGRERSVPTPGPTPVARRYDGVGGAQFENAENQLAGAGAPPEVNAAIEQYRKEFGGGATADNGYVIVSFNMQMGNVVLRAKAPTYRTEPGVDVGTEQTRYWSLCTIQELRPVDCMHDSQVVLDASGFFTFIVAPTCPQSGYENCLRAGVLNVAGGAAVDQLFYRNLLASESFRNDAGPRVCPSGESQFCGDYALRAEYVARP